MSAFATHCDICKAENAVPSYGDWQCIQCGQKYEYDESDRISLTDAQWALLRNPPQWIPVSERLPEDGQSVLVWMPDLPHAEHGMDIGSYMTSDWGVSWMVSDGRSAFPTHWMPLPRPPEVT